MSSPDPCSALDPLAALMVHLAALPCYFARIHKLVPIFDYSDRFATLKLCRLILCRARDRLRSVVAKCVARVPGDRPTARALIDMLKFLEQ